MIFDFFVCVFLIFTTGPNIILSINDLSYRSILGRKVIKRKTLWNIAQYRMDHNKKFPKNFKIHWKIAKFLVTTYKNEKISGRNLKKLFKQLVVIESNDFAENRNFECIWQKSWYRYLVTRKSWRRVELLTTSMYVSNYMKIFM